MTITQAQLNTEINTNLPTTGSGAINAAIMRQTLTDVTTAIFQSANVLNVKSFGAVGNGVVDDYPAIKAADAAVASASGGMLYFPAGTYFVSLALQPSSGVNYQGAGKDVTIIKGAGLGPAPFNMSLVISATFTGGNHLDNLVGTAVTYPINAPTEGANTITTTTAANAGNFSAGQTVLISGDDHGTNFWYPDWTTTVVSASAGTGVITLSENLPFGGANVTRVQRITNQPQNIKISDMTILGTNDQCIQVFCGQNIIFDNIIIRAGFGGTTGASFGASACRNCVLQNSVSYGVILDMLGCFDSCFVNNMLNSGAIQFDGGTQNSLIGWNTINDPTSGNGPGFNGINLAIYTRRNRVLGNAIVNVPATFVGINSVGSVAGDGNHIIEGNTITSVDTTTTVGIDNNNVVNNTIIGNWINNVNTGVRLLSGSIGHTVEANTTVGAPVPYLVDSTSAIREPFTAGLWSTLTAASATPSVKNGHTFRLLNGVAQNVTGFNDGITGQQILIFFGDSNTTLIAGGPLRLRASTNYNPPVNTTMQFLNNQGTWYEISRVTTN